jgi:hypothetical protein
LTDLRMKDRDRGRRSYRFSASAIERTSSPLQRILVFFIRPIPFGRVVEKLRDHGRIKFARVLSHAQHSWIVLRGKTYQSELGLLKGKIDHLFTSDTRYLGQSLEACAREP